MNKNLCDDVDVRRVVFGSSIISLMSFWSGGVAIASGHQFTDRVYVSDVINSIMGAASNSDKEDDSNVRDVDLSANGALSRDVTTRLTAATRLQCI